jgi:hypothetical protein
MATITEYTGYPQSCPLVWTAIFPFHEHNTKTNHCAMTKRQKMRLHVCTFMGRREKWEMNLQEITKQSAQ